MVARLPRPTVAAVLTLTCALTMAACGSTSRSKTGSGASQGSHAASSSALNPSGLANTKPDPSSQHRGGTLHVITAEGWEHLDPAASYFQIDYLVEYATQTPLYTFTPTSDAPQPLLASGPPRITDGGKTVTVHIKAGWKFGPPVNRAITSKDVEWAFMRMFNGNVQNAYSGGYFPIVGATATTGDKPIRGISTPNATTIVFHLRR
jgi:peptide/nickel transport system substrate-binding protein